MNDLEKRKRNADDMEQQPPLKKIATDGPIPANSSPSRLQGETAIIVGSSDTNADTPSSSAGQAPNEGTLHDRGRRSKYAGQSLKTAAILSQVWKDDLNSGQLLVKLFELFGEGILSFIPSPEMSLFL